MKAILETTAIIALFVAAWLLVSTMTYNDKVMQAEHCQHMVQIGAWPKEACNE